MYNLLRADLFKIHKSKAIKVLFGITAVSSVLMSLIAYLIPQGKLGNNMYGIGFLFSDTNVMSILGAVTAAVFICGDYDNKIIHEAIVTGNSRKAVIGGKAIAFFCSLLLMLIPYAVVTLIALGTGQKFRVGSAAVGFLNLLTTQSGKALPASEVYKLIAVILTLLIVYLSQLSICVPLAFVIKKPVGIVGIYYGLTVLFAQLSAFKSTSSFFDNIFACTPYGGRYTFVTLSTDSNVLIKAIFASLIFISVMLAITYLAFRKSEIK